MISPWVAKGAIQHATPEGTGQFEHSSLAATVSHKMFAPADGYPQVGYLNARDSWAATFEGVFSLSAPRTDCPTTLPDPYYTVNYQYKPKPLTDLQKDMLTIVAGATEDTNFSVSKIEKWTDEDGVSYAQERLSSFFMN